MTDEPFDAYRPPGVEPEPEPEPHDEPAAEDPDLLRKSVIAGLVAAGLVFLICLTLVAGVLGQDSDILFFAAALALQPAIAVVVYFVVYRRQLFAVRRHDERRSND